MLVVSRAMVFSEDFLISRLESGQSLQSAVGVSIIYAQEFLKVFLGPIIISLLQIVIKTVSPSSTFNWSDGDNAEDSSDNSRGVSRGDSLLDIEEKMVTEQYKSFVDDRKATKGNEKDIYMLKTHGYDKYRFVSKAFIKRNKLKAEE